MPTNKWWGYLHTNGSIQAKRYFDKRDLSEAHESPFVERVSGVVEAADRNEALRLIAQQVDLGLVEQGEA
jgi:hypothetical protein